MALVVLPKQLLVDANGEPLVGAKAYYYLPGTTTPITVYTTGAYGPAHSSPVESVSGGLFPAVYINPAVNSTYKLVIKTVADVEIYSEDNIPALGFVGGDVGALLWPRTASEIADGVTPVSYTKPEFDVRRYVSGAVEKPGWKCYGHVATYISTTSFSIAGDVTARYTPLMRVLALTNAGVTADMRLVSSTFAAGITTIVLTADLGQNLASPILAVSVQSMLSATGPGTMMYDCNISSGAGLMVINKNTGNAANARMSVFAINDATPANGAGLVIAAIPSTYSGAFLTGGYSTGPRTAIYAGIGASLEFGTGDTSRLLIAKDGTATSLRTDLLIGDAAIATATLVRLSGSVSSQVSLLVGSTTTAAWYTDATEMLFGPSTAIDLTLSRNGSRVLSFRGGNATGASTPTLSANKPGSNAGVIEWVAVKTSAGTVGWMPIFGN